MPSDPESRRKWTVFAAGLLAVAGAAWAICSRLPPPQLIADEQVFNTVDALFTAMTARDHARLESCEQRLKSYHEEGMISDEVAATLDAIIQQARGGKWEPAARNLYGFMLGQRGDD